MRRISLRSITAEASKSRTSAAIFESTRDGSKHWIVRTPDRPASSPSHVDTTSWPSAETAPMPVTTTRRVPFRLTRASSPDELSGTDGGRAIDVARKASRRDGVRGGEDVVLGAADLRLDRPVVERDERPGRGRVAVEHVARAARVDDHLPAELPDVREVRVAAADDACVGPRHAFQHHGRIEMLVEALRLGARRSMGCEDEVVADSDPALRRQPAQPAELI